MISLHAYLSSKIAPPGCDYANLVSLIGGRYAVDRYYLKFYCDALAEGSRPLHLAEIPTEYTMLVIDLDLSLHLSFQSSLPPSGRPPSGRPPSGREVGEMKGLYTFNEVREIYAIYVDELSKAGYSKDKTAVLLEKKGYLDEKKDGRLVYKNGFHLVFPTIFLPQTQVREILNPAVIARVSLSTLFPGVTADLDIKKTNKPWLLYGSSKRGGSPYLATRVVGTDYTLNEYLSSLKLYDDSRQPISYRESLLPRVFSIHPNGRATSELIAPLIPSFFTSLQEEESGSALDRRDDRPEIESLPEEVREWVEKELSEEKVFKVGTESQRFVSLQRLRGAYCDLCEREHEKDNAFCFYRDGALFRGCHRPESKTKLWKRFEEPTVEKRGPTDGKEVRSEIIRREIMSLEPKIQGTQGIQRIRHEQWVVPPVLPPVGERVQIIQSHMGTGKTQAIKTLLSTLSPERRVLLLTPRRSLALTLGYDLSPVRKFTNYLGLTRNQIRSATNLIIQAESLYKVTGSYEIVIIDECESFLFQMTSVKTHKDLILENQKCLSYLLQEAKSIILLDAFISRKAIDFLTDSNLRFTLDRYTVKPREKRAIRISIEPSGRIMMAIRAAEDDKFLEAMIDCLNKKRRFYLVCSSHEFLTSYLLPNLRTSCPTAKIEEYHSKKSLTDPEIRKCWSEADAVVTTTTITVGCNFDLEGVFSERFLYVNSASKNLVRDLFQSLDRVRHTIENKLTYLVRDDVIGHKHLLTKKGIEEMIENRDRLLRNKFSKYYTLAEKQFKNLFINNLHEHSLSIGAVEEMVQSYLRKNNYIIEDVRKNLTEKEWMNEIEKTDQKKEKKEEMKYHEIEKVDEKGAEKLLMRKHQGEVLTKMEHASLTRHFFDMVVNLERAGDDDLRDDRREDRKERDEKVWRAYCNYGQDRFGNIRYEKTVREMKLSDEEIKDSIRDEEINIFSKITIPKLLLVRRLLALLSLESTQKKATIKRTYLQSILPTLKEMRSEIETTFKLRNRKNDRQSLETPREGVDLLNEVLGSWGYSKIKADKRRRERVNGVSVSVTDFIIAPSIEIEDLLTSSSRFKRRWLQPEEVPEWMIDDRREPDNDQWAEWAAGDVDEPRRIGEIDGPTEADYADWETEGIEDPDDV